MPINHKNNVLFCLIAFAGAATAAPQPAAGKPVAAAPRSSASIKPCSSVEVDPKPTMVILGKTTVVRLDKPVVRMIVGGQPSTRAAGAAGSTAENQNADSNGNGADAKSPQAPAGKDEMPFVSDVEITLLSPTEMFVLGRKSGSMNVVLQRADGQCLVKDIIVTIDSQALQMKFAELMPEETGIGVKSAENSVVLTGMVSDALKLDSVMNIAEAYGDGKKVVNLLRVGAPQQVMLEVKIAEVSKTLLERFGLDYSRFVTSANGLTSNFVSGIIGGRNGVLGRFHPNVAGGTITGAAGASVSNGTNGAIAELGVEARGASLLGIEAQQRDGLVRVLAEPNIMAISGQQASFLSGGRIFIPVAQTGSAGGSTITLEEKEFGVGLKFMPTVLDGSRVNLKLTSEVSELSQTGSPFTTVGGVTSILPSITTRKVDTTVQLNDGQSFAVAGLIRHNVTQAIDRFPGLGHVPIVGALFRSTEFQNDQTELMFVITPRLVKPSNQAIALPTDNHIVPSRTDSLLFGRTEGQSDQAPLSNAPTVPAAPAPPTTPAVPVTPTMPSSSTVPSGTTVPSNAVNHSPWSGPGNRFNTGG